MINVNIAENESAKAHYVDENNDEDSQYITPRRKRVLKKGL